GLEGTAVAVETARFGVLRRRDPGLALEDALEVAAADAETVAQFTQREWCVARCIDESPCLFDEPRGGCRPGGVATEASAEARFVCLYGRGEDAHVLRFGPTRGAGRPAVNPRARDAEDEAAVVSAIPYSDGLTGLSVRKG